MVIYTAITNKYDTLPKALKGFKCVCFTDDPELTSDEWEIRYIKDLNHKEPKILNHKYFPNELTLWIDANVDLHSIPEVDLDTHLATFKALDHQCAYQEAKNCIAWNKDTEENIEKMVRIMKADGYPEQNGMSACAVILRYGDKSLIPFEKLWWDCVQITKRDQVSFNYALWKTNRTQNYISGSIYSNEYCTWNIKHNGLGIS
jgi:hypothetical protein